MNWKHTCLGHHIKRNQDPLKWIDNIKCNIVSISLQWIHIFNTCERKIEQSCNFRKIAKFIIKRPWSNSTRLIIIVSLFLGLTINYALEHQQSIYFVFWMYVQTTTIKLISSKFRDYIKLIWSTYWYPYMQAPTQSQYDAIINTMGCNKMRIIINTTGKYTKRMFEWFRNT